ncbi:hypothetical protein E2C01_007722 [Portunus trituberculatus]|uniref:Uncharacterized protein n=1 Tax=Portunus trituberculatus TaxID=210409 RepID=A0A5B7CYX3_PORTR|nr:hypothetical protein [Portunus trituberculatus]
MSLFFLQNLLLHNSISLFCNHLCILFHPPLVFPALMSHDQFFPLD